jgi:hypothetical protein
VERKKIKSYLKANGKRDSMIRSLVSRARKYKPQIQSDIRLLDELVMRYEKKPSLSPAK